MQPLLPFSIATAMNYHSLQLAIAHTFVLLDISAVV
jgi:hypothetical protein